MVDNYFIIMEIVGVNFLENEYFCVIVGLKRFNYLYNLNYRNFSLIDFKK